MGKKLKIKKKKTWATYGSFWDSQGHNVSGEKNRKNHTPISLVYAKKRAQKNEQEEEEKEKIVAWS